LLAVLALVAAVGLAAGGARSTGSPAPEPAPCTAAALGEAFVGPFALRSMDAFGCVGDFAYAWATVGPTAHEISVTEVLRFGDATRSWAFVSRLAYCTPGALPEKVYRLGCFSN